jgi:hypothetical protein
MKKTLVSLMSIIVGATAYAQRPTPVPKPSPTILETSSSEHPFSILEYRYPDGTVRLEAINQGRCFQTYYLTYSDFSNVDRSSNMAKMLLPISNMAEQGAKPGESCWVGGLIPANPNEPVGYRYRLTMKPYCTQAAAFDVHLDEVGRKAHPKPPDSEWGKLRSLADAVSAGDARPFEWVLDPTTHRPTQILRAGEGTAAEARIYGNKSAEEFGAELNDLIKNGMNPAQAALKLQEEALRDFRTGIEKNTMIVTRASDGTLHERPATAAELEALRKKYAKYMKSQSP